MHVGQSKLSREVSEHEADSYDVERVKTEPDEEFDLGFFFNFFYIKINIWIVFIDIISLCLTQ